MGEDFPVRKMPEKFEITGQVGEIYHKRRKNSEKVGQLLYRGKNEELLEICPLRKSGHPVSNYLCFCHLVYVPNVLFELSL